MGAGGGGGGGGMRSTIRCCISCILPCGVLDVVRIVHSDGRVEEISGTVRAAEIMKLHPKHVLKKPSSPSHHDTDAVSPAPPKIVIVPPDAELQRGKIYFLMPAPPDKSAGPTRSSKKKRRGYRENTNTGSNAVSTAAAAGIQVASDLVVSDRYLSEILSEKLSTQKDYRRRGRVGVWRPHLESISETPE